MKTLLLGLGNPILTDDSVGIRLARDLGERLGGVPGLTVREDCQEGGLDILPLIAGHDRLIVLDAIHTAGGHPGSWYRFTAKALRPTEHLRNVHDANFATALALGRRTGFDLPDDDAIHVFAVEIADDATFGEDLSPSLRAAYPEILAEILGEIRRLLAP